MATTGQITGMLLEEALRAMLRFSGYQDIRKNENDPTLGNGQDYTLCGRGSSHQIDVVLEPEINHSFTNPLRLLIEAKALSTQKVDLRIVRNAVGTIKDLSEFWVPQHMGVEGLRRFNYRYAIFTTSEITVPAQKYAFAHDIYLMPLRRSSFFVPITHSIDYLAQYYSIEQNRKEVNLTDLRNLIKRELN